MICSADNNPLGVRNQLFRVTVFVPRSVNMNFNVFGLISRIWSDTSVLFTSTSCKYAIFDLLDLSLKGWKSNVTKWIRIKSQLHQDYLLYASVKKQCFIKMCGQIKYDAFQVKQTFLSILQAKCIWISNSRSFWKRNVNPSIWTFLIFYSRRLLLKKYQRFLCLLNRIQQHLFGARCL